MCVGVSVCVCVCVCVCRCLAVSVYVCVCVCLLPTLDGHRRHMAYVTLIPEISCLCGRLEGNVFLLYSCGVYPLICIDIKFEI